MPAGENPAQPIAIQLKRIRGIIMNNRFGEVLLKKSMQRIPIQSIACFSNSRFLAVGQTATDEKVPTLSIVDIESGNINKEIEIANNFRNHVWKVIIDNNDKYLIYIRQELTKSFLVIYDIESENKEIIYENDNNDDLKGIYINKENILIISIGNNFKYFDLIKKEFILDVIIDVEKNN